MFPLKDNIPTDRFPIVTVAIIALNVAVYFLFQKGGLALNSFSSPFFDQRLIDYGAIPYEFSHWGDHCGVTAAGSLACEGQPGVTGTAPDQPATALTALTSMFMHGSLLHLGGNMLFLWIFGNNVEDSMGPAKFVAFYLLGGAAALTAQTLVDTSTATPTIGASGAVSGVLGGYLLLYPRARVITLIFIVFFVTVIEVPAVLVLVFWFLEQVLFGALDLSQPTGAGGGVAYFAHIGGFVFGLALIKLFADSDRTKPEPPRGYREPVFGR